jgi:hypothetical protein
MSDHAKNEPVEQESGLKDPAVDKEVGNDEVEAALARETQDGKGGAVVPESDFESYSAGENVLHEGPGDDS